MMKRQLTMLILLLLLPVLLVACGDESAPISTGEQGGQVPAPDTLNTNGDDASAGDVEPGDAETIGQPAAGDAGGESMPAAGDMLPFADAWTAAGAAVSLGGDVPSPLFEGSNGQTYLVNDEEIQVYQFADEAEAEAAAATISPDGGMINDVSVRWAGAPHFYRQGNTIVVYIGGDIATLDLLGGSFGEPFAGTATAE
ncbi:hypothetical protein [Promineifilum sp.]|uniref:hypothetical protein n=1 Tax=Promineifilum sp. TaxID=2664178 RepID=UPI0035AE7132